MKTNLIIDPARKEWNYKEQGVWVGTFLDATAVSTLFSSVNLSSVGVGNSRLVVKSHIAKIHITNQANANVVATIYDIDYRKDVYSTTDDSDPYNAWVTGLAQQALGTGSDAFSVARNGITPFQSPDFCRSYKVRKVTKIYMELGKSHIHTVRNMVPKTLNTRMLDVSGVQATGWRNTSTAVMIVFHGMPVNDGTFNADISLGSGAVDMVIEQKITFNADVLEGQGRVFLDDNQVTIGAETFMNEQTGVVSTYAEA